MDKELPLNERERRQNRIRYYQWVPFLLLFQAILCYIPRIIWRTLNIKSGLDIVNLVDAAIKYESVDKFGDRERIMAYIIKNIERYIGARKSRYERLYGRKFCTVHKTENHINGEEVGLKSKTKNDKNSKNLNKNKTNINITSFCQSFWLNIRIILSTICFWTGKRLGNYLVVLYMFVKTLWLTNAISQLFLLNSFIGNNYQAFGIEIIQMLLSGQEWNELRHFPRVTYCDFKIREIGNSHDWTVQCVLRINLFNEVIYIFMWFWLCILAFFSAIDYITWAFRIFIPADKLRFIERHLDIYNNNNIPMNFRNQNDFESKKSTKNLINESSNNETFINNNVEYQSSLNILDINKEKKLIKEFTFNYLKDDGVFAMRILASSASDLIVTEIISELWKNFRINYLANQTVEQITLVTTSSSKSTSSSPNSSNSLESLSNSSLINDQSMQLKRPASSSNSFMKKNFNLEHQGPFKAQNFVDTTIKIQENFLISKSNNNNNIDNLIAKIPSNSQPADNCLSSPSIFKSFSPPQSSTHQFYQNTHHDYEEGSLISKKSQMIQRNSLIDKSNNVIQVNKIPQDTHV
jgi:hypothetical protein